jgi:hypothetical protein
MGLCCGRDARPVVWTGARARGGAYSSEEEDVVNVEETLSGFGRVLRPAFGDERGVMCVFGVCVGGVVLG